jgi:predicted NBD/HSP70 family sugar kinase
VAVSSFVKLTMHLAASCAATVVGVTTCYLAIDVGGAKLAAAIVGDQGEVLVRDRIATPQREVWPALARLVLRVLAAAPSRPLGCGVGCGGPMNPAERTVSPLYVPRGRRSRWPPRSKR